MRERDRVHLSGLALILLKGRDHLRVRRPHHDRVIAVGPTRIVRRVSVILHAIRGELLFSPGRDVAHPKVPIAKKNRAPSIGRKIRQGGIA